MVPEGEEGQEALCKLKQAQISRRECWHDQCCKNSSGRKTEKWLKWPLNLAGRRSRVSHTIEGILSVNAVYPLRIPRFLGKSGWMNSIMSYEVPCA